MAELMPCPSVEDLLRELATIGDVRLSAGSVVWFVSVYPHGSAPLWWHGAKETLEGSLLECRKKAVELRFLKDAAPRAKAPEPQRHDHFRDATEMVRAQAEDAERGR